MAAGQPLSQPARTAEQLLQTYLVWGPLGVTEKCDLVPAYWELPRWGNSNRKDKALSTESTQLWFMIEVL